MDTKKIGAFLKQCRKEKNLTQEQLAEKFGVSARTVSRWETGINMPDLSILVQLAEYYDVEMRELLDGERSQTMNKEMKETLDKVAVYEEWVKQKALKAGNLAFASMFVISVLAIIIQMLLTVDIRLVLGETATALVGGILYASIMVYNGIWDKCLPKSATIWRDFLTSVICAGIFTVIYGVCLFRMGATETQITRLALGFLIGITIVAFIVLRLLAFINRKRNQNSLNVQEKKKTFLIPTLASLIMGVIAIVIHLIFELFAGPYIATIIALLAAVATYGVSIVALGGITEEELLGMPKGAALVTICRRLHLIRGEYK